MIKSLTFAPNDVLTTKAKKVTSFDKKLKSTVNNLVDTLKAADNPKGVGLAAPQIGLPLQIFAIMPNDTSPIRVFINPKIIKKSKTMTKKLPGKGERLEGCLSIPKVWGNVKRYSSITLSYQDVDGKKHTETFTDFEAVIIQHETDHVNGTLFTQRVLEQKSKLYTIGVEDGEEVLEEMTI